MSSSLLLHEFYSQLVSSNFEKAKLSSALFREKASFSEEQKKEWAEKFLQRGKVLFFRAKKEFSEKKSSQKRLLLASSRCFRISTHLEALNFESWFFWGNLLYFLGKKENDGRFLLQAKEKYEKALLLSPKILQERGALYWNLGRVWLELFFHSEETYELAKALENFKLSASLQPSPLFELFYDLGRAHFLLGNQIGDLRFYFQALDYFQRSLLLVKNSFKNLLAMTRVYKELYLQTLNESYFSQAHHYFSSASQLKAEDQSLWIEWAELLIESGKILQDSRRFSVAVEKCSLAHKRYPQNLQILGKWIEALALLGASKGQKEWIAKAEKKARELLEEFPDLPGLWYAYGICQSAYSIYYDDIDFETSAIEHFQYGLSLNRSYAKLWFSLANSHKRLGLFEENKEMLERALKFYEKALYLQPYYPSFRFAYTTILMKLGEVLQDFSLLQKALSFFEESLLIRKKQSLCYPAEWLFQYGCLLDLMGDFSEEATYYHQALEIFRSLLLTDPDFPQIYFQMALCFAHLAELLSDPFYFRKALSLFALAVEQNPEEDCVFLEWGLVLIALALSLEDPDKKKQYFQEAEKKLRKAGSLGNLQVFYHLACLCSLTLRFDEAIVFLQKAKESKTLPSVEELLEDEWLEELRSTSLFTHFLSRFKNL